MTWPDDEPQERLAEGHVMSDAAMVPRKLQGGDRSAPRPLVDEQLADQLLGKAASCLALMACCLR